jgi:hypothetical protein
MHPLVGAVLLAITVTVTAWAEPFRREHVAQNATWMVHIDGDGMRQSLVMQRLWQREVSGWEDVEGRIAAIVDQMCMDPSQDLSAILAYGPTLGSPDGVLIVYAAVDRTRLVERVRQAPEHRTGDHREFVWHAWVQADGPVTCGFFRPDVLVFAKTDARVMAALDVLDGRSPAIAPQHPLAAQAVPSGTILLLRAVNLNDAVLPLKSPVIKQCVALQIAYGEHEQISFSELSLELESAETAEQVRAVLEGVRATALLQFGADPAWERLLKRIRVARSDNRVDVTTSAPTDEVWEIIETVLNQTP